MLSRRVGHLLSRNMTMKTASASKLPSTLIFDLDGCLYDAGCGLVEHVRSNLFEFMYIKEMVPRTESAEAAWLPLFKKYNQSAKALRMGGWEFSDDEYWAFMRSGADKFLQRDGPLDSLLSALPQRKFIMTNCAEKQALECLDMMGVTHHFDKVFGANFMGTMCKPEEAAFQAVCDEIGVTPSDVCFFEDSYKNLVTCNRMGMTTVFVKGFTAEEEGVSVEQERILDAIVPTLSDQNGEGLKKQLPYLFA